MTYSNQGGPPVEYSIGAALSETFAVLAASPAKFLLVAAVTIVPAILGYLAGGPAALVPGAGAGGWIVLLLSMILSFVCQAAITFGAFETLRGREFDVAHAISSSVARIVPVALLSFAIAIVIGIGLVALVVPGIIAMLMFYVALPVCVVESAGVSDSIGRSRFLTKGYRWKILGQLLALFIPLYIAIFLIAYIFGSMGMFVAGLWVQQLAGVVLAAITSIMAAVTYFRLRNLKEGVDLDKIASVFD